MIEVSQNELSDKPYKITFKPGLVTNYQTDIQQINSGDQTDTQQVNKDDPDTYSRFGEYLFVLWCILPLGLLMLFSVYIGRKNLPMAADQGLWG